MKIKPKEVKFNVFIGVDTTVLSILPTLIFNRDTRDVHISWLIFHILINKTDIIKEEKFQQEQALSQLN